MNVLLDHNAPKQIRRFLSNHVVRTAVEEGWETLTNGRLLAAANGRFDVLLTCDQNIIHQQNLLGLSIAIVAVNTNIWPVIGSDPSKISLAVERASAGAVTAVDYPRPELRRRRRP